MPYRAPPVAAPRPLPNPLLPKCAPHAAAMIERTAASRHVFKIAPAVTIAVVDRVVVLPTAVFPAPSRK